MKRILIPLLFIPLLAGCSTDSSSVNESSNEDSSGDSSGETEVLPKPIIDEEHNMIEYGIYPNEHISDEKLIASLNAIKTPLENYIMVNTMLNQQA